MRGSTASRPMTAGRRRCQAAMKSLRTASRLRRERAQHQHAIDQRDGRESFVRDQLADRLDLRARGRRG